MALYGILLCSVHILKNNCSTVCSCQVSTSEVQECNISMLHFHVNFTVRFTRIITSLPNILFINGGCEGLRSVSGEKFRLEEHKAYHKHYLKHICFMWPNKWIC